MSVHKEILTTANTASGSLSANTASLFYCLLSYMVIKPASEATEYNISITDENNVVIFSRDTAGTLREQLGIPIRGVLTVAITSATADEAFARALYFREV